MNETILIVDDDAEVVRLMRGYLQKEGYIVAVALDGKTALQKIRWETPDLVLLDLMLPDTDGWTITRTVRRDARLANLPIIMLTARVDDADKIVGLELGGDDYVTKPYNPREVVARVRARLRVQKGLQGGEGVLKIGRLSLNPGRREVWIDNVPIALTATEFDILHTLMTRAGYVMTRRELIRKALGDDYEGIERTLDSHVRNLRRKLEADNTFPRYVQTVYGVGYRLEEVRT